MNHTHPHVEMADIATKLLQLSRPTFVNGRWRKAELSGRKLADVRRALIAQGEEIPLKPLRDRGGDKPFKLTKWERNREGRQALINENMKRMTEMIADYRKKVIELRQKTRKTRTEEEEYLLAIGKTPKQEPDWQALKNKKAIKQKK